MMATRTLNSGDLTPIDSVSFVGYFNMLESTISFGIETISIFEFTHTIPNSKKSNLVK